MKLLARAALAVMLVSVTYAVALFLLLDDGAAEQPNIDKSNLFTFC